MTTKYVRETPWPFQAHPTFGPTKSFDPARGVVELAGPRKSVAIIGFADSCRELAPFDDPAWERWGLNQLARYIPVAERWFEIHHRALFESDIARGTDYVGWLRTAPVPIYMLDVAPEFPTSVRYPIERVTAFFGREYLTSTPAYMMALAIMEGFERIGIYGIDLIVGREYAWEKPCMEYWVGQAEARGIEVVIPKESALVRQGLRYGLPEVAGPGVGRKDLADLKAKLDAKREELLTGLNNCDGALQAVISLLELDDARRRGLAGVGLEVQPA